MDICSSLAQNSDSRRGTCLFSFFFFLFFFLFYLFVVSDFTTALRRKRKPSAFCFACIPDISLGVNYCLLCLCSVANAQDIPTVYVISHFWVPSLDLPAICPNAARVILLKFRPSHVSPRYIFNTKAFQSSKKEEGCFLIKV